jgi:hypothetical protein
LFIHGESPRYLNNKGEAFKKFSASKTPKSLKQIGFLAAYNHVMIMSQNHYSEVHIMQHEKSGQLMTLKIIDLDPYTEVQK